MHLLACLDTPSSATMPFVGEGVTIFTQGRLSKFRNEKFGFVFSAVFSERPCFRARKRRFAAQDLRLLAFRTARSAAGVSAVNK
jgi:predicted ABC-type transport system involved in lysophospholipase L1 biosynthesis ATPase subunit